jgi:hypothetical protein
LHWPNPGSEGRLSEFSCNQCQQHPNDRGERSWEKWTRWDVWKVTKSANYSPARLPPESFVAFCFRVPSNTPAVKSKTSLEAVFDEKT